MKLRIDKMLKFWVNAELGTIGDINNLEADEKRTVRVALQEFENQGYARRRLDEKGRVRWEATPAMRKYLREAELEASDE